MQLSTSSGSLSSFARPQQRLDLRQTHNFVLFFFFCPLSCMLRLLFTIGELYAWNVKHHPCFAVMNKKGTVSDGKQSNHIHSGIVGRETGRSSLGGEATVIAILRAATGTTTVRGSRSRPPRPPRLPRRTDCTYTPLSTKWEQGKICRPFSDGGALCWGRFDTA